MKFEELTSFLRNQKGLLIHDDEDAEEWLRKYGYYSLINGYKELFKDNRTGRYLQGTTLSHIFALYQFDDHLRQLFFSYTEKIEQNIKALLTDGFTKNYGYRLENYMDPMNYNIKRSSPELTYDACINVHELMLEFKKAIDSYSYSYINHYRKEYDTIPLWVTIKAISFRAMCMMYDQSKGKVQVYVKKHFDRRLSVEDVGSLLAFLRKIRNVCAHNEKLFDFLDPNHPIPTTALHHHVNIRRDRYTRNPVSGKTDLFAAVICFTYFLDSKDIKKFSQDLETEVTALCLQTRLTPDKVYKTMGFPNNWKKILTFRKEL